MKTNKAVIIILITLMICLGAICNLGADEVYNLNGEWNAVITYKNTSGYINKPEYIKTEKDTIKISQQGNQFVGIRINGGKLVGKNEEEIKGKLLGGMVDEAFVNYPNDPTTWDLTWREGRATITEGSNKIVIQSFIREWPSFVTITLTRKQ